MTMPIRPSHRVRATALLGGGPEEHRWLGELVPAPTPVRSVLSRGDERAAIQLAARQGVTDENALTDLVFFARHPERDGRRIQRSEQALVREWLEIRDHVVRPALAARPTRPQPESGGLRLVAVESPGGGRVRDKRDPAPGDVATVPGVNGPVQLHRVAADAWRAMVAAARADGLAEPLLLPSSGYRSSAHQARLWKRALARYGSAEQARKWVAPPGRSAHQSGRAIDLYLGSRNDSSNVSRLRAMPAYRWLVDNAVRFGFYPYEREPWHWEYNPPAAGVVRELPLDGELLDPVLDALRHGRDWVAVRLAIARGIRDESQLTDTIFFARHPDRDGAALRPYERELIREWLKIRDTLVRPALAPVPPPATPATGAGITPAPPPGGGFAKDSPRLRSVDLAPARPVTAPAGASSNLRRLAATYNRLGGLLAAVGREYGIGVRAALAVWYVESAGRSHTPGRAIIRFENHLLYDKWGKDHPTTYDRHFRHGGHAGRPGKRWHNHEFRTGATGAFRKCHTSQDVEYEVLDLATRLAGEDAALRCISIGGPQILGSNHALIGYRSPRAMLDAFQADERWHVLGFVDYCRERRAPARGDLVRYLGARDWRRFARYYNGPGQVEHYGARIGDNHELTGRLGL